MKKLSLHIPVWLYFSTVIIISCALGYFVGKAKELNEIRTVFYDVKQIRLPNEKYPLISKLIGTELPSALTIGIYTTLYNEIQDYVENQIKTKPITKFSFYFRDLNTGLWFGMDEDEEYIPASLFKLPVAMAYYKDSVSDPGLLSRVFVYTKDIDSKLDTQIGLQKSELIVGNSYTVSELIDKMLIDSDNGAKNLLTEHINVQTLNALFNVVQLDGPAQNNYYISPKEYAFFLRILYNSSYLGSQKSEDLLTKLSQTTFNQGLRKVIPADIMVVHKFGSVNLVDKDTNQKQIGFHDCGIVYYPEKPFILCFMTSGNDQAALVDAVEKVTSYILDFVHTS